nr:arylsulfatase [Kineobactrum salinum]
MSASSDDRRVLPHPAPPFRGVIRETAEDSRSHFSPRVRAPQGAPNVLLVMTDDVGFAAASTFGGLIDTPTLDQLAEGGLVYNNFHTTAVCSPSRAALLTGRNHHAVGTGIIPEVATGFPGYNSEIPKNAATIASILKYNGYSTAMFGKHHNVPISQISTSGPFDNWPTSLGFEHFYGFIGSQTDQWAPALIQGTSRIRPPEGQHLDQLLADDLIRWLRNQKAAAPKQPFFAYLAPGTAHAPIQAPRAWIEKFQGRFDQGWNKAQEDIFARQKNAGIIPRTAQLNPLPAHISAWSDLTTDQRRIAARLMEVYAAQVAHFDHQFGRVIAELERMDELDNTLIIFIQGDNGASTQGGRLGTTNDLGALINRPPEPESWLLDSIDLLGGPDAKAHYPAGWAMAMNTPFRYAKRIASHLGGTRTGMVVSWRTHIQRTGGIRPQFQHLIDIAPTILEAAKLPPPEIVDGTPQQSLDGKSMMAGFNDTEAPAVPRVQYFEILGNRAIYANGWMASTTPPKAALAAAFNEPPPSPTAYQWELYNLRRDFSQSTDLARQNPEKLESLKKLWWKEARDNDVLPIDNSVTRARFTAEQRAHVPSRSRYTYWGPGVELERANVAPILNRSYSLNAHVIIPERAGQGVMTSVGSKFSGWSFFLKDGRPVVVEAFSDQPRHHFRLTADEVVTPGPAVIGYEVRYRADEPGVDVSLHINGRQVGSAYFPHRVRMVDQGESFAIGEDIGIPVATDYTDGGPFNGQIEKVHIDILDHLE